MPAEKPKTIEALVLCVDRDDDLGKKAGVKSPVIGEDANFAAAKALAMADPEDSDVNAILAAIKVKRECDHLYKGVEVVTITGDKEVGVKSDQKLGNQLVRILEEFKPKGVILVTDGAEDEAIIPLIQSETKILSVKTVTVKLSRPLESAYFKIQEFFKRIGDNPQQARMMFGLPGFLILTMVLLSYLGIPVWEVVFALIGIYLIAKGFGYDEQLFSGLSEVKSSLFEGRIYKVFNILAVLVLVIAAVVGYYALKDNLDSMYQPGSRIPLTCVEDAAGEQTCTGRPLGIAPGSVTDAFSQFPLLSLNFALFYPPGGGASDLILAALVIMAVGFSMHNFVKREYLKIKKYLYVLIAAGLVKYVSPAIYWAVLYLHSDSNHIVSDNPTALEVSASAATQNLLIAVLISFVVLFVVHYLLKIVFFDYISRRKQLEDKYVGKWIAGKDGKKLGQVTRIVVNANELKGIGMKKKYYPIEDVQFKGEEIVVKE